MRRSRPPFFPEVTAGSGLARDHTQMSFGVYVHIPFCAARCDYCDFATWTDRGHLVDAYVDACVIDLERRRSRAIASKATCPRTRCSSVAVRLSLLPGEQLVRILDAIDRTDDAEVTVECNPDSVDAAKLAAYRRGGVNRLSFGVQSMSPHVLAALEPHARSRERDARRSSSRVTAGFERINVDLIYGTPGEIDRRLARHARRRGSRSTSAHVSAYALTVEPATPLGLRVAAGAAAPDDDVQADAYLLADELLGAAGFEWYEVSNWARRGRSAATTSCIGAEGEYLGIGCAAHGHTAGRRGGGTSAPPIGTSPRSRPGPPAEAGAEHLDPRPGPRKPACWRCAPAAARRSARARPVTVDDLAAGGIRAPGGRSRRAHHSRAAARVRCDCQTPARGGGWHSVTSSASGKHV